MIVSVWFASFQNVIVPVSEIFEIHQFSNNKTVGRMHKYCNHENNWGKLWQILSFIRAKLGWGIFLKMNLSYFMVSSSDPACWEAKRPCGIWSGFNSSVEVTCFTSTPWGVLLETSMKIWTALKHESSFKTSRTSLAARRSCLTSETLNNGAIASSSMSVLVRWTPSMWTRSTRAWNRGPTYLYYSVFERAG